MTYLIDTLIWQHPEIGIVLLMASIIIGGLVIQYYFPPEPTDYYKVLDSLNCNELKDWAKYNQDSVLPTRLYVSKCLQV